MVLTFHNDYPDAQFQFSFDGTSAISYVELPTTTYIDISSLGVYNAAYSGGTLITSSNVGATNYIRAEVTDPFGAADITGLGLVIGGASSVAATVVNTATCTKTYEYAWAPTSGGSITIQATATEGTEGTVTDVSSVSHTVVQPTLTLTKTKTSPASGNIATGDLVTYNIAITNNGTNSVSTLPLQDFFDAACFTFVSASFPPNLVTPGDIRWTNLTAGTALAAGATRNVTVTLRVKGQCATQNSARVQGAVDATGATYPTVTSNVSISVEGTPVAVADDHCITAATALSVLSNDTDDDVSGFLSANAASYTVTIQTPPAIGSAVVNADKTIQFTPGAMTDDQSTSFVYRVTDATGLYADATVTVRYSPDNDVPVIVADNVSTTTDKPVTISVLSNDTSPDGPLSTPTITVQPKYGTVTVNADKTITYTPFSGFDGTDNFTYQTCDPACPTSNCVTGVATVTVAFAHYVCKASTATVISVPAVSDATSYTWTVPAGAVITAGSGTRSITVNFTGVTAGTYNVTAKAVNSCGESTVQSVPFVVTEMSAVASATNVACRGASTGSIDLTVSNGNSPYTYAWTGPSSYTAAVEDISELAAGTYNVTVTDKYGCTATASATLTQPAAVLALSASTTDDNPYGTGNGAIDLSVSGGTTPYTYSWTNGATTQDITGLIGGAYYATVTDANGCSETLRVNVNWVAGPLTASTIPVNVSCNGGSNGSIDLAVTGGIAPYTYVWTKTGTGGTYATTEDISTLSAGTYTITVTDATPSTPKTYTTSVTITEPAAAVAASATTTNVTCYDAGNGSIDVSVSGGTSPYTYNWTHGPTTQDLTGLKPGTYTVTAYDANGCSSQVTKTITQPAALSVAGTVTHSKCDPGASGAIDITVTGGASGDTYLWSDGSTAGDRTGLAPGDYSVIVTSGGCTATKAFTVGNACIGVAKTISNGPINNKDGTYTLSYSIKVENKGDVVLNNVQVQENLSATFASATTFSVVSKSSGDFTINTSFNGSSDKNLISTSALGSLAAGTSGYISFTVTVTPGATLGVYNNTATATATDPNGQSVTDDSENGTNVDTDGDGNPGDDDTPTPVTFTETPVIGVAKWVSTSPVYNGNGTYDLTYTIRVQNLGNVPINSLQVTDNLNTTFGSGNYSVLTLTTTPLTKNNSYNGGSNINLLAGTDQLAVNGVRDITLAVRVTPTSTSAYNNTAVASGTGPGGTSVTDNSQTGMIPDSDNDGVTSDNDVPTPVSFTENPSIGLAKRLDGTPVNNNDGTYTLTYKFVVKNTGNVSLKNVQVTDNLSTTFPGKTVTVTSISASAGLTANSSYNGSSNLNLLSGTNTLAIDASETITLTIKVTPGSNLGAYNNQATATAQGQLGTSVSDLSHNGADVDPENDGATDDADVTPVTFTETPKVGIAKTVGTPTNNGNGTHTLVYTMKVENIGNVPLSSVQVTDDLSTTFSGATTYSVVSRAATGTLTANSSFNGNSDKNLLVAGSSTLAVGASSTITLTVTVTPGTRLGVYENTAVVTANSPSGASVTDQSMDGNDPDPDEDDNPTNNAKPTPTTFTETPGLTVTKSAGTVTESPAGTYAVTFTIQVQNSGNIPLRNLQLQDDLRAAFPLPNTISVTAKSVSSAPGSSGIAINSSYNGTSDINLLNGTGSLNPGESSTVSLSISVTSSTGGVFENKALAYGTTPGGVTTMGFDPESVTMDENPVIGLAKNLKSNTPNAGYTQYTLTYELTVKNHGNVTLSNLEIFDDILTEFSGLTPTGFSTAVPSDINVFSSTLPYNVLTGNTTWTGGATSNILEAGQELAPGQTGKVWITFTVTPGSVTSKTNSATAKGTSPAGTNVTDVSTNGLQTDPDSDGNPSNNSVVTTATFESPTISGTVYNDNDGLNDSKVDGTGSTAGGLYVNLVNSSGNVVASKAVGASGTYTFTIGDGVVASTSYMVILTNAAQTVGNALSTATLASGWVSTGEDCCDDAGSDGTIDGKVSVTSTGTAVTNVNFGVNRTPTATSNSGSFSNPGGTNTVQVPSLAGTDPEDVTLGSGNPMTIVTLPTNGTLYYDNVAITTTNFRIASYDPTKLTFDPNDAITSASFTFKVEDAAGSLSPAATITLNFNTPTITLTGTLTPFVICTGTASTPQTLTVSGSELQADITVSAPTGYEVSLSSGSGYAASITVAKSGTTVSATTIYVRLKADATNGASGNVSASSTSATAKTAATGSATVNSLPTVTVSPSAPSIAYAGSQSLTASGASTYSWTPSTGLSATTGAVVTANPTTTTTYTVTGTDANGCVNTANVTVTVAPQPVVTLTGTLTPFVICTGTASTPQTLTVSGSNLQADITVSAPTGYEVSLSSGSGYAASITVAKSGTTVSATTIYVRLKSDATNGASGNVSASSTNATAKTAATGTATVNSLPTVTVSPSAPSIAYAGSQSLTASGASTYSWTPSTGLSATTGAVVTANPTTTTTYTVTGTDANGCVNTANVTVTVAPQPVVTLTGTLTPFVICTGTASTPQTLTVSGSNLQADITVSAPTGYEVSLSSGSGYAASITVAKSGTSVSSTTIYVRLKSDATNGASGNVSASSTNATAKTAATGTATVNSLPTVTVSPSAPSIAYAGSQSLTASGASTYSWTPSTGLSATTGATVTATLTATTTYTVTGTDANGCVNTANVTVTVGSAPSITLSGTLSPFSTCAGTASSTQTLTVSGSNLEADILVSAPTGYEVSLSSGTGFGASVTVPRTGTSVSSVTIYVRLKSNATNGVSGNVTASSTNATTQSVSTGSATVSAVPTTANAGPDQTQCNNSAFTLAGNVPTTGTGAWSVVGGTATITNSASANSGVTGVPAGTSATLRWTITNGVCPSSWDEVVLTNDAHATTAEAGIAQDKCNTGTFTMAANAPTTGTGTWSVFGGIATITNPLSNTTTVSGVPVGTSATLRWTVTNGTCSSTDDVVLKNDALPTTANAGADQIQCSNGSFTLAGNTPSLGTGNWTVFSGTATIGSATSPSSSVTGIPAGTSATLRWTTTNGTCTSTDDVVLTNNSLPTVTISPSAPSIAFAGSQSLTASGASTYSWTPSTGLNTTTGATVTATLTTTATYTVTGTDANGCQNTATVTVTVGSAPSVTLSGTLSPFSTCAGTASSTQTLSVSGSNLQADILVSAPTGYEISLSSGTGFGASVTVPRTGTSVSSVTIYVRLKSDATNGVSGNVTASTTNATMQTVSTGSATVSAVPTTANAGPDQTQCDNGAFTLAGNVPTTGTGAWSVVGGTATITNSTSANSGVTGVPAGTSATLRWTITNGVCPSSWDEVVLTNDAHATTAEAGIAQDKCNTGTFTMAANAPTTGTGTWSVFGGIATIANPLSNTTTVSGVPVGTSATLRWTVTNGTCSSTDDVVLKNDALPTTANAGADQAQCSNGSFTMAGNVPTTGTGLWTVVSGTATITTASSPTSNVTGIPAGTSATLRWTTTNGTCTSQDDVILTNNSLPTVTITPSAPSIVYSTSVSLTASGASTYTWTPSTGLSATTGATVTATLTTTTTYTVTGTDANGCQNTATVTVTVGAAPTISGRVYDDADGLTDGQVDGTGTNAGGLYVNLVNAAGNVLSSKAVNADGTYTFTVSDGVAVNTNFSIILTTSAQTVGNALSTASLVSGWVSMGEDCCDGTGSDGTPDSKLSVSVTTTSLNNANFGVNRTPTATPNSGSFTNPGGTNTIQVPTLAGTDPEDGPLTSTMIISTLPTGGTLYYNGTPVTAGQTITSYDPTKLQFDPNDGITSASFTFKVVDAAGVQSPAATITMNFGSLSINGTVYDDADGLTDGQVDGTGSNAGGLFVNLVNAAGNVVASKAVNANGTYSFTEADGVQINTTFSIILTTSAQTVGNALSTASLVSGWVSMGEDCCDGTGSDGTPDSKLSVSVTTTSLNNANFGVNRTPTATPNSGSFTNPGGTNTIQVPTLAGTDPEDGPLTSTMIISTLPTGGTLYYNGTPVTAGQTITSYDPTKLQFDPNDGITSASFTFKVVDAAGVQSPAATITMNFGSLSINGTVYDDADGLTDGQVDGTGSNAGGLFVNLVNAAGNVVASKAVNANGTYSFTEADGVQINTTFSIILTTSAQTVGNALSTASLVSGWVSMGEDCCDGTGSDGTPDSKLSVSVTTTSLNNANFGLNRTPTATPNSGSFTNPGGTNRIQVPTLAGTDPEDGALTSTMIISTLPTGGTLYYNGTPVTAGQTITSYDPTKLQFDPNDGITSASFTFKVVDAAGVQSPAATITMNFASLSIAGMVYDDADGLTDGQVDGTGTNAGGLFVNLVNSAGNVVASKAVNANGSYTFTEADGVQINTNYSIILTTASRTVGSPLSSATINTGWVSMGEDCCDGTGSDGTPDSKLSVSVAGSSVGNANFGLNRTPTATPNSGSFTNPGGTNTVQVPTLAGTDPEDGALTSTMIISTLPTGGTLYYNGTQVTAGQTITSYDPTKLRFDPNDGITSASFTFKVVDAAGVQSPAATITMNFASLSIAGMVYDDADGLTDGQVDGTGTNAGGLFVNLVNSAGNVVASKAVNANGSYTFTEADGVQINTNYSIILTTASRTVGSPLSSATINTGWVSMGEDCCDGTGSDGTPDSKLSVSVAGSSVSNANFGLNRTPTATPNSGSFTNPGGTNTIQVPTLAGTDPEDGALTSTMIISTLPTGGTLYYNGTPVMAGQTITSYDPTKLRFDPNDGITSASFTFKVVDAAGVQSPAATITMNFASLSIAGMVYDDADGLTDGQVDGTGTNAGGLFVNLVNSAGNVVASKAVNANGSYTFTEADGVQINTNYSIILTTASRTVGSPLSSATINTGWVSMGEDCCDGTGSDGTPDSKLSVSVAGSSVGNANFGLNRTPTATPNSGSFTNPGGTNTIQVPTLAGTDPEDGALTSTMIISTLPTGGTLYYNGTPVTAGQTITSYDPTKLRFDPNDGITSASFTFKVVDAAGVQSPAATITMNFASLSIAGMVYDDADGLTDGQVDGTGTNAGGLFVNLVNASSNVLSSKAVNADGTYSFTEADGVQINTNYSIILTTASRTVGSSLSSATINTGWVSMGEDCCDGTGSDGTPDSKMSVSVAGSSVGNAYFGLNRTPTATPNSGTFLIPVGNQTIQVPTLAGTDPEDGALTSTMIITTLPSGGTLYYNGTPVTAGQTITGYDPTKLQFDPNDGITIASFTFKVVDAAGVQSPAATITMNFNPPQLTVTGSLTPFITCAGTATAPQTLTVSGMHLVTDITAMAPAGYEISLNPTTGYAATLTIAKVGSSVPNTTVYVRLSGSAVHSASGNISFSVPGLSAATSATGNAIVFGIPTIANAGADQVNCNNGTFTMAGNVPTVGTGTWTLVSGTATITTPTSATTTITGVPAGTSATLRWTVGNGTCPSTSDDMVVTNTALPTPAAAGADLVNCNNGSFTMVGNVPTVGTGVWSVVSGTATVTTPTSATTTITGVPAGTSATLRWTISNGICPVSTDELTVTNTALPTPAAAGADLVNCNNGTFIMAGNVPTVGTGVWSVVSGTATITTPSSATTTITGVPAGTSATLRWTISNGICPVSTDELTVTNTALPTPAAAGADLVNCNNGTFTMAGNVPTVGTGVWSVVSGTATITTPTSATTTITGVPAGTSATLRWTISNGICPVSTDELTVTNTALPIPAAAGADLVNCNNGTFTMAGNVPTVGTGVWSVVSGTATITTPTSATTTITGVPAGTSATLRWTISNGICPVSTDELTVTNTALPTPAAAGADLVNCNNGTFTMAGNVPTVGTGVWSVVSGTATITTPTSATTTITGVPAGTSAILRWTISNGICPVSTDELTVTNTALPTPAAAGADLINCNNGSFTMVGNVPTVGTGVWSVVSGTATVTTPTSATTTITGVPAGTSATLRWTISNGICPVSTDELTVTNQPLPTTAAAGPDQALCNTSIFTMAANTPSIGTGRWTLVSGTAMIVDDRSPTTSVSGIAAGASVTLRWSITNGICAASTDEVVLRNKPLGVVTATTSAENCGPASLTLTATASAGATIRWFDAATGGNLLASGSSLTTPVLSATTIYYAEALLDGCPSLVRMPATALIKAVPPTPVVTAQGPTTFCAGLSVTLMSSATQGNQWYRNGVLIPGATNQSYIVNQSGNYHVVTTNAQGCSSAASAAMAVVVNPIPAAPAAITGLVSVTEGSSQTYTATPVAGATAYIWTLPSGWTGSSTTNTITVVPGSTGGRIMVRATANGCTSPLTWLDVTVVDEGEILKVFKSATTPELQPDGTYLIRFTITLKNLRNQQLTNVQVTDDLTRTFPNPITFQVMQVRASGGLSVDPLYNGRSLVQLLTGASTLGPLATDSINLSVKIEPNGYAGNILNIADVTVSSPLGKLTVQSIDMSRSGGRDTGPGVPTLTVIKPVQLIIPTIFTPNNDGFNDKWVIVRPSGVRIKVQVYNRWGQMVYRSDDYRNDWDGKGTGSFLGKDLPHGSYFFLVDIENARTGEKEVRRGALMLKRDTY